MMKNIKIELSLGIALTIIGLCVLFYRQIIPLFGVILFTTQVMSGLLVGGCFIIMGWFSGDRGLALLMRLEAWRRIRAEVHLLEVQALVVQAEALAKLQTVTIAKPGHEVVISQIQHPLLPAQAHISNYYVPALPPSLPPILGGKSETLPPEAGGIEGGIKHGAEWIQQTLFDEYGQLKVFHVKVDGPTGAGKTFLMLHLIWLLQQPHPAAEYWLSDPKFEGESSGWPFTPFITDFDQVAEGAEYLYQHVVTARKHARREGKPPTHPAFLIFDEADGCFDEHGEKFTKPVRRIIKEGRSGWTHCFVVGQSPLAKDAGFSGAIFRNTARFILGSEALAFTRNGQFTFWEKEHRDRLARQLMYLQEHGRRYALVIPPSGQGLPFVGEIPKLDKPNFINVLNEELEVRDETLEVRSETLEVRGETLEMRGETLEVRDEKLEVISEKLEVRGETLEETNDHGQLTHDEGYTLQFLQDWHKVATQLHLVKYRGRKPTINSLLAILDLTGSGRGDHDRVRAMMAHLDKVAAPPST